jgi:hypothetical protein
MILAVGAVMAGPVSALVFPCFVENKGKFWRFRPMTPMQPSIREHRHASFRIP